MEPDDNLYKLVYCSRNRIEGTAAEVRAALQNILATARRKNVRLGVTGALLYNQGHFAQVLEGPLESVEKIFEAIERDSRHCDVLVVYAGPAASREFPDWSMAFAGDPTREDMPLAAAAFNAVFTQAHHAGEQMLSALKQLVTQEDDSLLLEPV